MCINRDKIISAGKIDICVFDKTGTLTEDHLNIAGFLPVESHRRDDNQINLTINLNSNSKNEFMFGQYYDSVKEMSKQNYEYYKEIITQGLDLITTAVPPSLPCCLGAGIGIAQRRFKKKRNNVYK